MSGKTSGRTAAVAKRRYWRREDARKAVEAWQRSGETLAEFCRRRGLHPRRVRRWAKRLEGALDPEPTPSSEPVRFHPVQLVSWRAPQDESRSPIEIVLGDGRLVRVPPGFSAADLTRVLQVLAAEGGC
jgi:transposase